jgi:cell shape-determining protein MreC
MDMAFGRFFRSVNSSVDISVSFLERLVEKPKNAIRDVLSNLPLDINMEQTFLGELF